MAESRYLVAGRSPNLARRGDWFTIGGHYLFAKANFLHVIDWILVNVELRQSSPVVAIYDRMESQSGESLPVIYEPFDGRWRSHFLGRGQILDYAVSVGDGRILDFGPGDGWPSLLIAPMALTCARATPSASDRERQFCSCPTGRILVLLGRFLRRCRGRVFR